METVIMREEKVEASHQESRGNEPNCSAVVTCGMTSRVEAIPQICQRFQ
jgi:hypothetical protein